LSDDFASDGWGRKFTYAVTTNLATPLAYQADIGLINVNNTSGGPSLTQVHYAVVSHGPSGAGAFTVAGGATVSSPCATGANTRDQENCDNDRNFRKGLTNSFFDTNAFFDDYIIYRGLESDFGIPTGAVLPFQTGVCPDGWTRYRRSEGVYIAGAITVDTDPTVAGVQSFSQLVQFGRAERITGALNRSVNMRQNVQGEQNDVTMPAFVAMTYCEKLPL